MNKQVESWKRLRNIVIKRVKMNTFLELIHSRHSFRGEYQAVPVKEGSYQNNASRNRRSFWM